MHKKHAKNKDIYLLFTGFRDKVPEYLPSSGSLSA